ncbi:putative MFS transporter [Xylogone sp. PMI_703]|nr:putative MFS transporter [Xylogone sp. PMI_703]
MNQSRSERSPEDQPASWSNLPRKRQLFILAFCRVFDFMQVASFQTVCYYQLKTFGPSLPEETLSLQTGVASSSFSGAQIFTAIIWGRIADSKWVGRKRVLLIGLLGTGLSCIGLAFSRSFLTMVIFRLLAGGTNGTVGIIRTMISENIKERKHQSRAFLLLPASFMLASVVGPVCGSLLADPVMTYPYLFGANSLFGDGAWMKWLTKYPYALPALLSGFSMLSMCLVVFLLIEETLQSRKNLPDPGLQLYSLVRRTLRGSYNDYSLISNDNMAGEDTGLEINGLQPQTASLLKSDGSSIYRVWTFNVITTLLAQAIFDFHMGAFGSLWPTFLSTPRSTDVKHLPFNFNGGLGMEPRSVGLALAILGFIGIVLQFLIYPRVNGRLGNVQCFRIFCTLFPVSYGLAPFLVTIPTDYTVIAWLFITSVLIIHTTGRIFVLPATIVLINNCAPDPSVLGFIHGLGQTTSAIFRTLGPIFAGYMFSVSYENGIIGAVWWIMSVIGVFGWVASLFLWERPAK